MHHDDGTRKGPDRPWAALARELEDAEGPWSDFAAWRVWLGRRMDAMATPPVDIGGHQVVGFDPGAQLGSLDYETEIGLYVAMCELADGEAPTMAEIPVGPAAAPLA